MIDKEMAEKILKPIFISIPSIKERVNELSSRLS
jgi:hypothetical protein